ncbi:transposase [Tetragenococcus koreensis]|nr:transposase [Tetragenococcus koreensis]AYW46036.1 DDE transposase [Tetragenococcus koreensis]AYW46037.1 DDE transposase [Tetragenococcus koreensis]AYW46646.1 DDE transposase [Tetragenococcus koreensis]GEN92375.1 hypothetical protein TKO01_24210 [Tetragenococcus koreensis]
MNSETIVPYNINLFEDFDCGPLQEFEALLNQIPYQHLIQELDDRRASGRDDWPNDAMFRCWIAMFVFHHQGPTELINELERNPFLRHACHLEPRYNRKNGRKSLAPSPSAFTRFQRRLIDVQDLLDALFAHMTEELQEALSDLGESLALDGKIIEAYAQRPPKKKKCEGRRDHDANYTQKSYTSTTKEGKIQTKSAWFYGYRVHLIADARYELPLLFRVTPAANGEKTVAKEMVAQMPSWLAERCDHLSADKGYDGGKLREIIEDRGMKPIIDIVNHWQGESTRQYQDTDFVYTYKGEVYYVSHRGKLIRAQYKGYHAASDTLRYETHPKNGAGIHRVSIPRAEDPRVFNLIGRDSKKFQRYYNERSAVERVNGRIDRDYLFEDHRIRGLAKMKLHVTTTFCLMLAKKKRALAQEKRPAA